MGSFSATGVKNIDDTFDLLTAIKTILDGNKLEQAIKGANALSATELAKATEARELIGHYEALIAEHQKKKNALDDFHESLISDQKKHEEKVASDQAAVDAKKKENEDTLAAIAEKNVKLDERKKELDAQEKDIKDAKKAVDQIKRMVEAAQSDIEKDQLSVAALKKEAKELKDKAQSRLDDILAAANKE